MNVNEDNVIPSAGAPVEFVPDNSDTEIIFVQGTGPRIQVEPKKTVPEVAVAPVAKPEIIPPKEQPKQESSVELEQDWRSKIEAARQAQAAAESPKESVAPVVQEQPASNAASQLNIVLGNATPDSEALDSEQSVQSEAPGVAEDIMYLKDVNEEPIMDVPVGNMLDDLTRLAMIFNPSGDQSVIRERLKKDPDDFYVRILNVFMMVGSSIDLMRDYLEDSAKKGKKLTRPSKEFQDTLERFVPPANGEIPNLTGKEAKLAVLARSKGLPKIHLFNSGFWLKLRPPRIAELSQWYNEVSMETKDFGRLIGGHVFLFSDVLLKKKFMEILPSLVVDSNLEGWRVPNRLAKFISIHDFDTIVWAVCTLIYKEAITINLHCTNEKCKYVAKNYKVDLSKLRFNNVDIIPPEALTYLSKQLMSSETVTIEQVKQYHKLLNFSDDLVLNGVTYKRRVPSVYRFIEIGSEFCRMILETIKGYTNELDIDIDRDVRINVAKTYLPWVYQISTDQYKSSDIEAITAQLELEAQDSKELAESMLKYQFDTKISYFCYTMLECPKCHKTPSNILTDYYPLDPTYLFFFQLSRRYNLMSL